MSLLYWKDWRWIQFLFQFWGWILEVLLWFWEDSQGYLWWVTEVNLWVWRNFVKLNRSLEVSVKWDEVIRKSTIWFERDLNVAELWKDCWVNQVKVVDFLKEQAKSYSKSNTSTKSSRSDFISAVFPLNNASGSLAGLLFLYCNILPLPSH